MALLRTVIVFVILVIFGHLLIVFVGVDPNQNGLTSGVVALGRLLETPARVVVDALPLSSEQQQSFNTGGLYFTGFAAAALYFVLFLLLGIGRR